VNSFALRALAATLTLLSGAVMMLAGYIGHRESWAIAGFITVPGGIVILAAFALARRADRVDDQPVASSGNHRAIRAGALAATLLSGGVMVFAGYAASAWGWGLAAVLATVGGLVVFIAFAFDRLGSQPTTR
jgi:2-keto-3-deoxy-galactonokinase